MTRPCAAARPPTRSRSTPRAGDAADPHPAHGREAPHDHLPAPHGEAAAAQAAARVGEERRREREGEVVDRHADRGRRAAHAPAQPAQRGDARAASAAAAPWPARPSPTRRQSPPRRLAVDEALERPHAAAARVAADDRVARRPARRRAGRPGSAEATCAEPSGGVRRSSPPCSISVGTAGYGAAGAGTRPGRHAGPVQAQADLVGRGGREVEREERGRADLGRAPPGLRRGGRPSGVEASHGSGVSSQTVA